MEKIDIIWFIEHVSRELDVACIAGYYLKKYFKKTVEILPYHQSNQQTIVKNYSPRIVVIPYCYSVRDSGLRDYLLHWLKPIYVNLSWEQLFYEANLEYKVPRDLFTKKYVIHHVWSKGYSEHLQRHGIPKDHIFVNGQPAYQLYARKYRSYFHSRRELAQKFSLDLQQRWLFFPENYSWAFYSDHQLTQIINYGQNRNTIYLMRDYCRTAFAEVIRWLSDVASAGSMEIILRPRPAIRSGDFINAVQSIIGDIPKNLHIIKEGTVREWIIASDIVISSFSTSLIEGAVAGKPVYMVDPIPIPTPLRASWYNYVERIKDKNGLLRILNKSDAKSGSRLEKWARSKLMGSKDSIFNLAKLLNLLLEQKVKHPPIPSIKIIKDSEATLPQLGNLVKFYSRIISTLGELLSIVGFRPVDNNLSLFKNEVVRRMDRLEKILADKIA